MSEKLRIGFAGLSHLGIIYSAASAARGFQIVAFDDRPGLADALQARRFPVSEPGLAESAKQHGDKIRYTADGDDLAACSLVFITLDVTTDDANHSDLGPLETLIEKVTSRLEPNATLVIMSQIPPGYCRKLSSRIPASIQLFCQVETLVFGNALERAIRPERFMVGCADVGDGLPAAYGQYLAAFDCPLLRMRYESAELCKIAINCFLVSSVTTSNTLAEICEKTGSDWSEITPALRLDRRIGPHAYLRPGLGIAGGNLERDLVTVQRLAAENGCDAGVVTAWQRNSLYRRDWALRKLFESGLLGRADARIGLWGLAYKQDTHSTKNSPSIALLRNIGDTHVSAYDPAARIEAAEFPKVQVCASARDAVRSADVLIVMTPWREFANAELEQILPAMSGRQILDPYGVLAAERCRDLGFSYEQMGA